MCNLLNLTYVLTTILKFSNMTTHKIQLTQTHHTLLKVSLLTLWLLKRYFSPKNHFQFPNSEYKQNINFSVSMQYTFIVFLHINNGMNNVKFVPHFWWYCTEIQWTEMCVGARGGYMRVDTFGWRTSNFIFMLRNFKWQHNYLSPLPNYIWLRLMSLKPIKDLIKIRTLTISFDRRRQSE